MRLFLHVGTEKTGSSFLQKTCGANREVLVKNDFYFADAGIDEQRLLAGSISPGNARQLSELIVERDWSGVSCWLEKRIQSAVDNDCDCLLLSHELLFTAFSEDGSIGKFEKTAFAAGVKTINMLLVVRNPIDQAISLFKHRAKNGMIRSMSEWILTNYSIPFDIDGFLNHVGNSAVELELRKYSRVSAEMVEMFFGDWLGLKILPTFDNAAVNPSLTLSELQVIRLVSLARPATSKILHEKLTAIPSDQKASDDHRESTARVVVGNSICHANGTWTRLDRLMVRDGGIEIPNSDALPNPPEEPCSLSTQQLQAIVESISEGLTVRFRTISWANRYLRRPLGRSKARIKAIFLGHRG